MEPKPAEHADPDLKCGGCEWLSSGFSGSECSLKRGCDADTHACIEYTAIKPDALSEAVADKYLNGVRDQLTSPRFAVDFNSISRNLNACLIEIDKYCRGNFGSSQDLEALSHALRLIVQYRSYVASVFTVVIDLEHDFNELRDYAQLWVNSKYASLKGLKNEAQRKAAFNRMVPEFVSVGKNIHKVKALAGHVNEQLQNNDWTVRSISSASEKLWFNRENLSGKNRG